MTLIKSFVETEEVLIKLLGKEYHIKSPIAEVESVKLAAAFLEEKMNELRDSGRVLSYDRIAVITALNMAHKYLAMEKENNEYMQMIQQRVSDLQKKVELSLAKHAQMELSPE